MIEITDSNRESFDLHRSGAGTPMRELKSWFVREVLPLEASLTQFLTHSWRRPHDIADLRQDIYVRVLESAQTEIPVPAKPFIFKIARNLIIDRYRRERIIPIEGVADLDAIEIATEEPGPDRGIIARDELRRLRIALNDLPPRCREAVILKRVEKLSRHEISVRMGIAENTVKRHLTDAARLLADKLYEGRSS